MADKPTYREFKDLYSIFKPIQSKEQGKSCSVLGLKNS